MKEFIIAFVAIAFLIIWNMNGSNINQKNNTGILNFDYDRA